MTGLPGPPSATAVAGAREVALAAAGRAGVEVHDLHDIADIEEVADLFDEVWRGTGVVPTNLIKALVHAGSPLSGARSATGLLGASLAFLGRDGEHLFLHSHVTGVRPQRQARGVGRALKLHQRAWALERGLLEVRWTFDPLVRHNAYFNLIKLGAHIAGYEENFYGRMPDGVNAGDESDRCVVVWDLLAPQVERAARDRLHEPDVDALAAAGAETLLTEDDAGSPVRSSAAPRDLALCKIPSDVVSLREGDPGLALTWRRALRATMGELLISGWRATSITRSGWYVLERGDGGPVTSREGRS